MEKTRMQKIKDGIKEAPETKGMTLYERSQSKPSDEYYTLPEDVERIEEQLREILKKYDTIICPFDTSESAFVKVLTSRGYDVVYSWDDYKNRLAEMEEMKHNACIISNPPFSIWREIVKNFLKIGIDFFLINNLMNAADILIYGIYGSYIGQMQFHNGKKVPCFMMSNIDIRNINMRKKQKKPFIDYAEDRKKIIKNYASWEAIGKPDDCYIYSTFNLTPDSRDYDMRLARIKGHFNMIYIRRKDNE